MQLSTTEQVKQRLERLRGQWKRVANESGVPYKTIKNLMQGKTTDPRQSTVEALSNYLQQEA